MNYWNKVNLVFVFTIVLVVLLFCLLGQRMERAFLLVKGGTTTRAPSGDGPKTTSAPTTTTTTSAPTTTTTTSAPTYSYFRYTKTVPTNSTLVKKVSTASRVRSPEESKNGLLNHRYYFYSRSHGYNKRINSGDDRVVTDDAIENCKAECSRHNDCEGFKLDSFWPEYGCELVNYRSQTASPHPGGDGWKGTSGTDWYAKRNR